MEVTSGAWGPCILVIKAGCSDHHRTISPRPKTLRRLVITDGGAAAFAAVVAAALVR
jgi:hypothetical protein